MKDMRRISCISIILVLFLSGCGAATVEPIPNVTTTRPEATDTPADETAEPTPVAPTARPEARYAPEFEPQTCWFEVPEGVDVTCGYLTVPEDRKRPLTPQNTLKLAVAIFHSQTEAPAPDPILYQVGGPGGHMLGIVPYIYEKVIEPFLQSRDLIFFDPRGTGFSEPALECEKGEGPGDCVRWFFVDGRNLYAYSSLSMAEDLQAIRSALGYDQWNLLGESYGTHVAQVTLREAPEGLRSVIMDSVMPIVLPRLPCEADPACKAAYPNLADTLQRAIQRLNQTPVALQTNCYGEDQSAYLTGERLTSMLFNALYETDYAPALPDAISAAADGSDYSFWNNIICWEAVIDDLSTDGAHWAMLCSDGRLGGGCEDWPVVVEQTPVTSEIPALVLGGEFDPVTPLEYGHSVAQTLLQSYAIDFPGPGHWVNGTGHACQSQIIQAFLDDPTHEPDTACLAEMEEVIFIIEP